MLSFLSLDASEQQRGQPALLPVCEVSGHTGPEVSTSKSPMSEYSRSSNSPTCTSTYCFFGNIITSLFLIFPIRCAPAKDYFKDLSGHWSWAVQWLQKKAS